MLLQLAHHHVTELGEVGPDLERKHTNMKKSLSQDRNEIYRLTCSSVVLKGSPSTIRSVVSLGDLDPA